MKRTIASALVVALVTGATAAAQEDPYEEDEPEQAPAAPIEVDSDADRPEPASTRLTRQEVRQLPGAFGDPFRAVEAMPGVTPVATGVPFFFVRGAPPGNVGYFLDSLRVPLLYHVGLGPSVIHPALVKDVALYPGAYPARYGRFAGGIVAAETTEPQPEWHGEGNIRVFDAGAMVEGGVLDDRLTMMLGGRYSYTGALLSVISPDVELQYWDYQARVAFDVTPRDRISVFGFGSFDLLAGEQSDGSTDTIVDTEFHRIDARYDRAMSGNGRMRSALSFGVDDYVFGNVTTQGQFYGARWELEIPIAKRWLLRAGSDFNVSSQDIGGDASIADVFNIGNTATFGARADLVYSPGGGATITPGTRVDYYLSNGELALAIEPRLSMRVPVGRGVALTPAVGLAHQAASFLPIAGFELPDRGLQQSVQSSFGVELPLPYETLLTVTAFHSVFLRLLDPFGVDLVSDEPAPDNPQDVQAELAERDETDRFFEELDPALGTTYGLEVYLRRRLTKTIGGYLSYTLSRSSRCNDVICEASLFDRTHVLSAAVSLDLGAGWRAGAKNAFYTGRPADGDRDRRTFPFYRLDTRLEKRWIVAERVMIALVFEVLNTTLRSEVTNLDCSGDGPCDQVLIGPVTIPSIGVEGAF